LFKVAFVYHTYDAKGQRTQLFLSPEFSIIRSYIFPTFPGFRILRFVGAKSTRISRLTVTYISNRRQPQVVRVSSILGVRRIVFGSVVHMTVRFTLSESTNAVVCVQARRASKFTPNTIGMILISEIKVQYF